MFWALPGICFLIANPISFINCEMPEFMGELGIASHYSERFWIGRRTASGEIYTSRGLTAAHKSAPFGTRFKVLDLNTMHSIVVRTSDRGPFIPGRIIDLSAEAAEKLGIVSRGITDVQITRLP